MQQHLGPSLQWWCLENTACWEVAFFLPCSETALRVSVKSTMIDSWFMIYSNILSTQNQKRFLLLHVHLEWEHNVFNSNLTWLRDKKRCINWSVSLTCLFTVFDMGDSYCILQRSWVAFFKVFLLHRVLSSCPQEPYTLLWHLTPTQGATTAQLLIYSGLLVHLFVSLESDHIL